MDFRKMIFGFFGCLAISSCSAVKASQKTGVEISSVSKCETLSCFYAIPTRDLLEKKELKGGVDHYRFGFQRRQGSILRGIGYGLAGVYTLGLSEVVTNPVEGSLQNDKIFVADVLCVRTTEKCDTLLLTQPGEETIVVRGDPDSFEELRQDENTSLTK